MTLALYGKTRRRQLWLLALALISILGATVFAVGDRGGADPVHAANAIGTDMEIDGNEAQDLSSPSFDWDTPPPNYASATEACDNSKETQHDDNDTINDPPGAEGPTTASIEIGPVQDKNDFCEAQYAFEMFNGDPILYLAWTRISDNGTGVIYFELNQSSTVNVASGGLMERTAGDVLIVYDYQGGGTPVIQYRIWSGSSWNAPQTLPDSVAANASGNLFGEAAINLSQTGLIPTDGDACGAFAFVTLHSTTGNSDTSTLQDIVGPTPLDLSNCVEPNITTTANDNDQPVIPPATVTDTADLTANTPTPEGSIDFFVCSDSTPDASKPGCATGGTQVGSSVTLVNGVATSAAFAPTTPGDYCFRAEYTPTLQTPYLPTSHTNTTTECFQVPGPDLGITKTANPVGPVAAGQSIGFDITVSNESAATGATNVTLSDSLPAGTGIDWDFNNVTGGASCNISGTPPNETLNCSIASLAAGASFSVHVFSSTTADSCSTYDNTAAADADNADEVTAQASVTVDCPDLTIDKTPESQSVLAGDQITFTITINNGGSGEATGVDLNDPLPGGPGIDWSISPANASCSITGSPPTETLQCLDLTIAANSSFSVTVVSDTVAPTAVADGSCGLYENTASFTSDNDGSGEDSVSATVLCAPELTTTASGSATPLSVGDTTSDTANFTPEGSLGDVSGTVDFFLCSPAQVTGGGCETGGTLVANDVVVSSNSASSGPSGALNEPGDYCWRAEFTGTGDYLGLDTSHTNNTTECVTVLAPDVTISKTPDEGIVSPGGTLTWTIVVTNNGQGTAKNVVVTDQLLAGLAWNVDQPPSGCSIDGSNLLTCDLGDLAPGGSVEIQVSATLPVDGSVCGPVNNTADVDLDNGEGGSDDGSVLVVCAPDVAVEKTAGQGLINPGDDVSYSITVTNLGPGTAVNVTLDDDLPAGAPTWTLGGPDASDCSIAEGTPDVLTCNFGDIAQGDSRTITLSGTTPDNGQCGPLTNTATVAADNEDETKLSNNSSTAEIPCVLATGNLVVRKFIDFNGNRAQDGGDTLDNGWAITIVCTGPSSMDSTIITGASPNPQGTVQVLGLNEGTTCTVSEAANSKTGYSARGFNSLDVDGSDTGAGTSTVVTIDDQVIARVDFFNQPLGNIVVNKTTLRNGGSEASQNGGWHITVTGCGINQTKDTIQGNPQGSVTFSNLPACANYVVSEDANSKPGANPAFSPSGSTAVSVNLSAGETETVQFTNVRNDPTPTPTTPPSTPTPTNTPTPTPTPTNTPTPTATPTNTPTPIDTVLGEKTPGPPSTGNGFNNPVGGASANLFLAVAGLAAMSVGFYILAALRRRSDEQ